MDQTKTQMVFKAGKENCVHKWMQSIRQWKVIAVKGNDPKEDKLNTWRYSGETMKCESCGREELLGGTIRIPEGGDYFDGEYQLEANGSRGMCIINGSDMTV